MTSVSNAHPIKHNHFLVFAPRILAKKNAKWGRETPRHKNVRKAVERGPSVVPSPIISRIALTNLKKMR
jgi:hypothetical protein